MLQLELGDGRADKRVGADDAVDVVSLLNVERNLLPDAPATNQMSDVHGVGDRDRYALDPGEIDVSEDKLRRQRLGGVVHLVDGRETAKLDAPRVEDERLAPRGALRGVRPGLCGGDDVDLIVYGDGADERVPVRPARWDSEGGGESDDVGALATEDDMELGEPISIERT
jgi:hypothetical protein